MTTRQTPFAYTVLPATEDDIAYAKRRNNTKIFNVPLAYLLAGGLSALWLTSLYAHLVITGGYQNLEPAFKYIDFLVFPGVVVFLLWGEQLFRDKYESLAVATEKRLLKGKLFSYTSTKGYDFSFDGEDGHWYTTNYGYQDADRFDLGDNPQTSDSLLVEILVSPSLRKPLRVQPYYTILKASRIL